ncbi:MAG: transmembrane Mn(2+) transporter, partial [Planctomycetaceae bacterium]|nr:transmembrane Mn(2+) transporter [Planctomycetaceae bacterium]
MIQIPSEKDIAAFAKFQQDGLPAEMGVEKAVREAKRMERIGQELEALGPETRDELLQMAAEDKLFDERGVSRVTPTTRDDKIWVTIIGLLTSGLLYVGRYRLIERFSVVLVVSFTFITLGNVVSLQTTEQYAISGQDLLKGLAFGLPDGDASGALVTALATLGIIG